MRELLIENKVEDVYKLSNIREGSWPTWKGDIIGGDPILNGWATATQAVKALYKGRCAKTTCSVCWGPYAELLARAAKENLSV